MSTHTFLASLRLAFVSVFSQMSSASTHSDSPASGRTNPDSDADFPMDSFPEIAVDDSETKESDVRLKWVCCCSNSLTHLSAFWRDFNYNTAVSFIQEGTMKLQFST